MSEESMAGAAWEQLSDLIEAGEPEAVEMFLNVLPPTDISYVISHLEPDDQTELLEMLPAEFAASLFEYLSDDYAADLLEELSARRAAAIVDELPSDDQADIISELPEENAEAILEVMDPEEAAEARRLLDYDPDVAGGLMITEYLVYPAKTTVGEVIADLRANVEEYAEYHVQYVYVTERDRRFAGVVRMRDLVMSRGDRPIRDLIHEAPASVNVDDPLDEVDDFFDRHPFAAAPVLDAQDRLRGVVLRVAVEEAISERADKDLARFGGIIGGEELRSMPLVSRCARRLAYLVPNILLLIVSISVIAVFERSVVEKVTALAIFLPMVAGLTGCGGNQAVAVSIRELSLDIARPADVFRVLSKELHVGLVNGLVISVIVFISVLLLRSDARLALVVAAVIPLTLTIGVMLGGCVPLVLRGVGIDPAMASGPIVTTTGDLFSFLALLLLAWALLDWLMPVAEAIVAPPVIP